MNRNKKKQIKGFIALSCSAILILSLALMPMIASGRNENTGPQASILSAAAKYMDLETQLIGGGQLSSQSSLSVDIPENVKLTGYLVGNGDIVNQDQPIATADKVSVMKAISKVQETLDYLSSEIKSAEDAQTYNSLSSLVSGTVKAVYAQPGDLVEDVMLQHGALLCLSLDGLMAVQFKTDKGQSIGNSVDVSFEDGSSVKGRVASNISGTVTVTIEDDNFPIGEKVRINSSNGAFLGTGELYVYSQWNAIEYSGTVSSIYVSEGSKVYSGSTLMVLNKSSQSAEYQRLVDQRHEYEALMHQLFVIYSSGVITSPCDGIVSGIDNDASFIYNESSPFKTTAFNIVSSSSSSSSRDYTDIVGNPDIRDNPEDSNSSDDSNTPDDDSNTPDDDSNTPDDDSNTPDDDSNTPDDETSPAPPPPSYIAYLARVVSISESFVEVLQTPYLYSVTNLENLPSVSADTSAMTVEATYSSALISASAFTAGDIVMIVLDDSGEIIKIAAANIVPGEGGNSPGQSGGSPDMSANGDTMPSMGGTFQAEPFELYSTELISIATVSSQEEMTVEMTIDERDISKLYLGQEAKVTIDAIAGEQFKATISQISNSGINEGGSSKFTVKATVEKNSNMLPGMNANVFIKLDTALNALCIPAAALELENGESIVYTSYNEKKELFGGALQVETGLADADNVQILSGLCEGNLVYYSYYENQNN